MRISFILTAAAMSVTLSGCGKANASGFDPSNPLHCAAQFESYSIITRQQGDELKGKGFGARATWYANRARSLPAKELTDEALTILGDGIAAAPDGGLALATECMKRQDANPEFQRFAQQK